MGMDPLTKDETLEVTFVLHGPITRAKLQLFRAEIETFLDKCATIDDGVPPAQGGGKKLQIRQHRAGVRKNVP